MTEPAPITSGMQASEVFVGRDSELREIADFLTHGQSVSLVGPLGMGKSALLRRLADPAAQHGIGLGTGILYAYLDGATLGERTPAEVFGELAAALATALYTAALPPEPALAATVAEPSRLGFEAAVRRLNGGGLTVVLALDAFDRVSGNPQLGVAFFNALRSAAARLGLVFLTASERPLIELTDGGSAHDLLSSPFFNIFASVSLGPLSAEESRLLLRALLRDANVSADAAAEETLYALAGGYPLAVRIVAHHAAETPGNDDLIAERSLRELEAPFTAIWRGLTPAERAVLRQVADASLHTNGASPARAIPYGLVRKELVVAGGATLRYASELWARFLALLPPTSD